MLFFLGNRLTIKVRITLKNGSSTYKKFYLRLKTKPKSYQTFFFVKQKFFPVFTIKLDHFTAKTLFSYVTNALA